MGDRITRPATPADLARAKFLKQALQRGTPALSRPSDVSTATPIESTTPESLALKKAFLEDLVECAPEAASILENYVVTRINDEFSRLFGFKAEEAIGQRIDSLIVPPDRSSETSWIGENLAKGKKVTLETKRQRKDGTQVDVFVAAAPVVIGGRRVASYVMYRDITEQKRAEAVSSALYRIAEKTSSAEDLQQFYAAIHAIVGELTYARNLYIALYDPLTQMLSFPYFVDAEDPTPAPKKMGRGLTEYVLRTGEPLLCSPEVFDALVQRGEVELIGAPSVDWLGVPLKAANHTFGVLVLQSYSDNVRFRENDKEILTFVSRQLSTAIEHKRNEEALRRSEARYRSLVQSAVYGIYRSSLDGRFLDVNPALIAMLGYSTADEVLSLDPKHDVFLDPNEQGRLMREFQSGVRRDNLEVQWKRKDSSPITVRLSGRAVSSPGEPCEVLEIIAEDVTERRVLEDQFRQAQKMEAVGRLAGGVAHDFNNLLMVINGYTEVLLEQTDASHPFRQKIEAIQQAADRATTLTRQLLAFSRKQFLELKLVDVNAIVSDMERLLRPLIGENIELIAKLAMNLSRTRADAGQIEQVIMNLVVNSKDAMPNGGKIIIQTANVSLDDDLRREYSYIRPGPYVMLSISDTGVGMDKETQSRIFEPFFTTKEKGKGTGLGLSTAYGIIKQSGGYVFVHSELGRGTTFRIYLPQADEPAEPLSHVRASQAASGGSETVLLVEDEESVRQLVRETLEAKGYKVLEAEQGHSALEIAAAHQGSIDMLITDVVMPGMSGRELAQRLSGSHPRTKVLYVSGYTEDAIVHQGVLDPGTAFLQKPFTLQALSRKVRDVLRTERE
ncbi:MAG: PAS domain S-box protein [Acidobacteriia bacterium]|nr:PAS domain S-box protein [Terriglobia bacterium]